MEQNKKDLCRTETRNPASESDFSAAARQRWRELGEELKADVASFSGNAGLSQPQFNEFRVSNLSTGLGIAITADFDARIVRYNYTQLNDSSAGTPEGGILSMRRSPDGNVELYSADERLTPEETRKVLLEPVLLPPQMAA